MREQEGRELPLIVQDGVGMYAQVEVQGSRSLLRLMWRFGQSVWLADAAMVTSATCIEGGEKGRHASQVDGSERIEGSITHCKAPSFVSDMPLTTDRPYHEPGAATRDAAMGPHDTPGPESPD